MGGGLRLCAGDIRDQAKSQEYKDRIKEGLHLLDVITMVGRAIIDAGVRGAIPGWESGCLLNIH